ncbi:MAG: hypothetical protein H7099_18335 [Gemmatimonadaceae bacterium]|nr:hypothetical protein [Gemmatimonadaceae bacterium]
MTHACRRWIAGPMLLLLGVVACGESDTTDPTPVDAGVTVSGLKFTLSGAVLTTVSTALPASDAAFAAPVVTINRPPTATVEATVSVSAAEPFTAVLVQPAGSASYLRINLPAQTTLIGISVLTNPSGSASVATAATVAVVSGTRTSRTSTVSFQSVSN